MTTEIPCLGETFDSPTATSPRITLARFIHRICGEGSIHPLAERILEHLDGEG